MFVFGSNLAGRHGAGSAREAVARHGAVYGRATGPQGNAYAIPTKDRNLRTLPLDEIRAHVDDFIAFAIRNPDVEFDVVAVGCGLAGYAPADIAPMFRGAPPNCHLPKEFI